jgi:hypothetical protein
LKAPERQSHLHWFTSHGLEILSLGRRGGRIQWFGKPQEIYVSDNPWQISYVWVILVETTWDRLWALGYSSWLLWLPSGIKHETGQSVSALSPSQYKQMTPGHQLKGSRTNMTAHKWQTAVFLLLQGARSPFPAQSLAQHQERLVNGAYIASGSLLAVRCMAPCYHHQLIDDQRLTVQL